MKHLHILPDMLDPRRLDFNVPYALCLHAKVDVRFML